MFCNKNKIIWSDLEGLRETVRFFVKESRFAHILGVEHEAVNIAGIFGYDKSSDFVHKLRAAAILHDITKEFDFNRQLEICGKYNIKLSGDDKKAVKPLHAKTGAHIAKIEFSADNMIMSAIYNHTLGGASKKYELSDRIICLADWTEPNRTQQDCVDVRGFFYSRIAGAKTPKEKNRVLDETMLFCYNKSIEALIKDNLFIHKEAFRRRNALINKKIMV
jgi:nicotinate-nucleotide adenylyltransferase